MRPLLTSIAAVSMLLTVCFASLTLASDRLATPTAESIEQLIRDKFAEGDFKVQVLSPHKGTKLREIELLSLDQVSSSHWFAEVEMLLEFGPPPPSIVGFQRERRWRYQLFLKQHDDRLELLRFSPVGGVYLLPVQD